jgi:excisionase family DNA binding protein
VVTGTSVVEHPQQGQLPEALLVFTPEEACRILRVSRASLYRRVREGEWPHRIMGDGVGVRFSAADLRQILEAAHRPAVTR